MIKGKNKLIIFIIFLIHKNLLQNTGSGKTEEKEIVQTCVQGCSMCSVNNQCFLCDASNNYFLNNDGKCEQIVRKNCLRNSLTACLQCAVGFYFFQNVCVQVTESLVIQNCLYYHVENFTISCVECEKDHYVEDGECIKVSNPIAKCVEYASKGDKCLNCSEGIPSLDFKSCTGLPESLKNCQKYSFFTCQQCSYPNVISKNFLFKSIKNQGSFTKTQQKLVEEIVFNATKTGTIINSLSCNPIQAQNCQEFLDKDIFKCSKCKQGYFVNEQNACQLNPEEKIENCEIYFSKTVCQQCFEGYWRKSNSECVPVIEIPQCQNYSRVEESKCLKCQDAFYISENFCIEREISLKIQFCEENFAYLDQCEKCSTGYLTNQDMSKCLPVVTNCQNHQKLIDSLECIECIDNFFLRNQKCFLGSLKGCKKYSGETTCQDCQNGFYKDLSGECKPHELLNQLKCFQYSITSQNYCEQCHESRVKYQTKNICLEVEKKIENCLEYEGEEKCKICDYSVSYLKDGKCVQGTIANCREYDVSKNKCLDCAIDSVTGFGMIPNSDSENNSCLLMNPNAYQNCFQIDQESQNQCSSCKQGYYQQYLSDQNLQWCVPRNFYLFSGKTNTDNCNLYDHVQGQCLRCLKKSDGKFYVIHNGSCLNECPINFSILTSEFKNHAIEKQFVCKANSFFQNQQSFDQHFVSKFGIPCARYEIDAIINSKIYCAACSEQHIALYEQNTRIFGLKYQYLMTTSVNSTFSIYNLISPVKSCLVRKTSLTTDENGTFPLDVLNKPQLVHNFDNCRFLQKFGDNEQYYCSVCKHGYTGKVVKSVGGAFVYMIENCEIMTQCKSDVWIDGLGSYYHPTDQKTQINETVPKNFDLFLSCHKCNSANGKELIPTFSITINHNNSTVFTDKMYQDFGIGMYGFGTGIQTNEEPYKFESQQMNQTTCQEKGITNQDKFPPNCSVQMLNIFYSLQPYNSNLNQLPEVKQIFDGQLKLKQYSNPLCVACAPGYRPHFNGQLSFAVDRCIKIENCLSSNTFNQCEVCEPGYTLTENSLTQSCDINKAEPILENCLISSLNKCSLCKKGQYLNEDKQCDSVSTYKCKQQGYYQSLKQNLKFNITYNQNGIGCEQCTDDSILIFFQKEQPNCIKNDLLLINSKLNTLSAEQLVEEKVRNVSFFIKNCEYYKLVQDSIKCHQCKKSFILQINNQRCWPQESFPNCQLTEVGGVICKQCNEGYYFENTTFECLKGNIQNCMVYLNKNNCYSCDKEFLATSIKGNKTVCIAVSEINCEYVDQIQAIQGILECKQCKKGFQQIQTGQYGVFPLVQCLSIPKIEKCQSYNKSPLSVTKSSLECTQCDETSYLQNNECKARLKRQNELNCTQFEDTLDQCKTCKSGYYFDKVTLLCKLNPSSTQGCIEFKSEKECLKCKKNMYLKNNKCFEVEKLVEKCEFYLNSFECLQCEKNYFLVKQKCEQSYASNCYEQKDLRECIKCEEGWGLSLSGDVKSCQQMQVQACDLPDDKSEGPDFDCKNCSKNHYLEPNTKQCKEQQSQINQCKYYFGAKECRQCDGQYILSLDRSNCLNLDFANKYKDNNCEVTQQTYQCALCEPGYIFDETIGCLQCSVGEGCSVCDSSNINLCLMCKSGFYHTVTGECKQLTETKKVPVDDVIIVKKSIIILMGVFYGGIFVFFS